MMNPYVSPPYRLKKYFHGRYIITPVNYAYHMDCLDDDVFIIITEPFNSGNTMISHRLQDIAVDVVKGLDVVEYQNIHWIHYLSEYLPWRDDEELKMIRFEWDVDRFGNPLARNPTITPFRREDSPIDIPFMIPKD